MRTLSAILLAVCIIYGFVELRRWRSPEMRDVLTRPQRIRRIINYIALCIVIVMAFGGTWLPPSPREPHIAIFELVYWSVCLSVAAIVPIIAVWDMRAIVRQARISKLAQERDESFREVVETVVKTEEQTRRRAQLPHRNGFD